MTDSRSKRSNETTQVGRSGEHPAPTEDEIHREHRDALEATLFQSSGSPSEVVLELVRGVLHLRDS